MGGAADCAGRESCACSVNSGRDWPASQTQPRRWKGEWGSHRRIEDSGGGVGVNVPVIQQQSCLKHASNAAGKRNLAAQLACVASFLSSITTRKRCGHNRITLTLPRPDDKPTA